MKGKIKVLRLVLVLTFLVSGCAHIGKEVRRTSQDVIFTLEQAVDAFEQGDLGLCQDLLEGALREIPQHNYVMRRKALIGLGFVYLYNNNVNEIKQVSRELDKISRQAEDKNAERDPQEAIIQAIAAVNSGRRDTARKILDKNYKLYATGIKRLLVKEVK